jgi:hypothetical protein
MLRQLHGKSNPQDSPARFSYLTFETAFELAF